MDNTDDIDFKQALFSLAILTFCFILIIGFAMYHKGYIEGKNDVLSGKIKIVEVVETKKVFKEVKDEK